MWTGGGAGNGCRPGCASLGCGGGSRVGAAWPGCGSCNEIDSSLNVIRATTVVAVWPSDE